MEIQNWICGTLNIYVCVYIFTNTTSFQFLSFCQVLSYDQLLEQLDLSNVRELEDFLINECMYMVGAIYSVSYIIFGICDVTFLGPVKKELIFELNFLNLR